MIKNNLMNWNMSILFKILAAVIVLSSVWLWGNSHGYGNGYQDKADEYQTAYDEALQAQKEEYNRKVAKAIDMAAKERSEAVRRAKQEREIVTKTEKVIEYVETEILVPGDCTDLATDVNRVLIDSTRSAAEASRPYAANRSFITKPVSTYQL